MAKFVVKRVINEYPIVIPKLKLKGHIDTILFAELDSTPICIIIDFKTIGSYPYKKKFGRYNIDPNPSRHQELQLATYAVAVEKDFNISNSQLFIVYYNKDTSGLKVLEVKRKYMNEAIEYWTKVNEVCSKGLPELKTDESPIQEWECRYCQFLDICNLDRKFSLILN